MRAVWLRAFGGPDALVPGGAPDPVPGPGQVVIDVAFAGITFVETLVRAGLGPFAVDLPMIPGNGVGGVVGAVGPGEDATLVGARVISSTGGSGGYAERAAVDTGGLVAVPEQLDLDSATALLADGRTATMLMRAAAVQAGDRVLVEAAAGGLGTLLVQLARNAGATVVAAAGGAHKLELARELGAAVTADYTTPDWGERVRDAVGGVDVVFDGVGGPVARSAFALLEPSGRMLSYGRAGGGWAEIPESEALARDVTLVPMRRPTPDESRSLAQSALAEASAGRLRPIVGQRFGLERAGEAHAAIEARRTVGKTLLELG